MMAKGKDQPQIVLRAVLHRMTRAVKVWEANKRGGPMPLVLNIGKCTLLGNYRENNEDSIEVKQFPDMTICIVADGMGGQAAGEIASKRAIEVVPRELRKNLAAQSSEDQVKQ